MLIPKSPPLASTLHNRLLEFKVRRPAGRARVTANMFLPFGAPPVLFRDAAP